MDAETASKTVEWVVPGVYSLQKKYSPYFRFEGEEWYLEFYPNTDECDDSYGYISLYLYRTEPDYDYQEDLTVSFVMGLRKPDGKVVEYFRHKETYESDDGIGCDDFIGLHEILLPNHVVTLDGTITVACTLCIGDSQIYDSIGYWTSINNIDLCKQNFKDLFDSGLHGDVKIKVKDTEFNAHKCVLSARSRVFDAMFKSEMVEQSTGVVNISDGDPDCFRDFLLYVYTGETSHVSPTNAIGLYMAADKYDMKDLKKACCHCIGSHMSVDSVCDAFRFTMVHHEPALKDTTSEFFDDNWNLVVTTRKWQDFFLENPLFANELFVRLATK